MRSAGWSGSTGTYAPPALTTAYMRDHEVERAAHRARPTGDSGPTPRRDQHAGQPVHPRVELGVGQLRSSPNTTRDRVRACARPARRTGRRAWSSGDCGCGVVPVARAPRALARRRAASMSPTAAAGVGGRPPRASGRSARANRATSSARRTGRSRRRTARRSPAGRAVLVIASRSAISCRSNLAVAGVERLDARTSSPGSSSSRARECSGTTASPGTAVVRRGAGRVEHLDEPLERHVGVAERREVRRRGSARAGPAKRAAGVDRGAQHEGVDEHADQVVERGLAAAGDRGADRRCRSPARRRASSTASAACTTMNRLASVARPRSRAARRAARRRSRSRRCAPRIDCRRAAAGRSAARARSGAPSRARRQKSSCRASRLVGIVFGAEQLALPQGEVGVLHRERRPVRAPARRAGVVGDHHVARQRRHRQAVGGDVVHHDDQHVLRRSRCGAARPAPGSSSVTSKPAVGVSVRWHVELGSRPPVRRASRSRASPSAAGRTTWTGPFAVSGNTVRSDSCRARTSTQAASAARRRRVRPAAGHGDRDVVGGRGGVELVEEPHPLLRQRQRHRAGPRPAHASTGRARVRGAERRPTARRALATRRRLEQLAHPDLACRGPR